MVVSLGPGKFYGTSLPRPRIYTDVKFNDHRVDPPVPVSDPMMSWANEAHWSMGGLSFKRLRFQGKIEGNVKKLGAEREKHFKKLNSSPVAAGQSAPVGSKGENVVGRKRAASISPPPAPVAAKRRRFMAMIEEDKEEEEVEESAEEEEVEESGSRRVRRRLVKKLGDDFDKVALENERSDAPGSGSRGKKGSPLKDSGDRTGSMALRTRSRKLELEGVDADHVSMKVVEKVSKSNSKGKKKAEKSTKNQVDKSPVSGNGVRPRTSPRLSKLRSS